MSLGELHSDLIQCLGEFLPRFDLMALRSTCRKLFFSDRLIRILTQKRWFKVAQKLVAEVIFGVNHWSVKIRKVAFTTSACSTWKTDPHVTHLYMKYEPREPGVNVFNFFPNLTHFSSEWTQIGLTNQSAQLEHISIKRGQFAGGEFPCLRVLIIPSYKGCIRQILRMPVLEVLVTGICSSKSFVIPQQMTRLSIKAFANEPILIKNLSTKLIALQLPVKKVEQHENFFKTLKCCPLTVLETNVKTFNFEHLQVESIINLVLPEFEGDLSQLKKCKALQRLIIPRYKGDLLPISKISTLIEVDIGFVDVHQIQILSSLKQLCKFKCRVDSHDHEDLFIAIYFLKQHCPHLK